MIKRRTFITGLGSAAAWPVVARAQEPANAGGRQRKTHRIAVIDLAAPVAIMAEMSSDFFFRGFFEELRRLGYVEGENLIVLRFSGEGNAQRNSEIVTSAIRSRPDVIFAFSSRLVKLLSEATATIPIVGSTADPVLYRIVTSLARPDGNVTGISAEAGVEIDGKRLDLFKTIMPSASRLAVLTPVTVWESPYGAAIRMFAEKLGFIIIGRPLADPVDEAEFRSVFAELQRDKAEVVFVVDSPEIDSNLKLVIELAERAHLPTITSGSHFAKAGSLMSYGAAPGDLARLAAAYVDKVLRGAKPADLPIQQPTRFELVINIKTARALGLIIPETLLATADEVIQ